ncbi:hypothetical protein FKG94_23840 [Exilibacterium tricleocarpae]|uniref:Exonuclease domain-containing protein n=1 Tax=Exilibacterium tricleocarpae TaxID=2591008 RepID=A0A545ST43_9GAMM|nr:hypothetical protein [Exilibacterium tricleocarpae]TQV68126.1 hypothetical protein FKG94_23840 [Exilibacterium tricleocarpae]
MSNLIFIDVEASGLDIDSYPIEIALRLNGATHSWLIRPEAGWRHWCKNAEALHGLPRQQLVETGLDARVVAAEINALLASTDGLVYSDAAPWDAHWVSVLFDGAQLPACFAILPIQDLLDSGQESRFFTCLERLFEADSRRRHRAGTDVELIARAYSMVGRAM